MQEADGKVPKKPHRLKEKDEQWADDAILARGRMKEERVKECLYVCPECRHPCCRESSIVSHLHKVHQLDTSDASLYAVSLEDVVLRLKKDQHNNQYKCLKCDAIIVSRLKLSHHLCVNPEGRVTCKSMCPDGVGLSNWQTVTFLKHKREYLCHTCGTAFRDHTTFQMHVQSHGKGVELKKFICEHCPYATNNRFYFKIHTRGQHCEEPRPRPHVCELCGKTFALRGVLMQHKQYMHIKDKIFQCNMCPKFFYRHQGLARHVRTHSGQRPWVCVTCGQGFTVKYNLKVHERLHSGEKPYACKQCDAAFAQKNSLNVHMKKHEVGREYSKHGPHHTKTSAGTNQTREGKDDQDLKEIASSPPSQNVPSPQKCGAAGSGSRVADCSPVPAVREGSDADVHAMQYGYSAYPELPMTVFPSLPAPSYQYFSVNKP